MRMTALFVSRRHCLPGTLGSAAAVAADPTAHLNPASFRTYTMFRVDKSIGKRELDLEDTVSNLITEG